MRVWSSMSADINFRVVDVIRVTPMELGWSHRLSARQPLLKWHTPLRHVVTKHTDAGFEVDFPRLKSSDPFTAQASNPV